MNSNVIKLRANFENREAIFIEKGIALRVRVSNIQASDSRRIVSADLEEIPSPGLGCHRRDRTTPISFGIEGGYLTKFSDHSWVMGYGGWSLHFDPKIVQSVSEFAAHFPDDMHRADRYNTVVRHVEYDPAYREASWQDVF